MPEHSSLLIQPPAIKLDDKKLTRTGIRFAAIRHFALFRFAHLRRHRRWDNEFARVQMSAKRLSRVGIEVIFSAHTQQRVAWEQHVNEHFSSALRNELNRF